MGVWSLLLGNITHHALGRETGEQILQLYWFLCGFSSVVSFGRLRRMGARPNKYEGFYGLVLVLNPLSVIFLMQRVPYAPFTMVTLGALLVVWVELVSRRAASK